MPIDWTAFRQKLKDLELESRMVRVRQISPETPDGAGALWDQKLIAAWDRIRLASITGQAADLAQVRDELLELEKSAGNDRRHTNAADAIAAVFQSLAKVYQLAKQENLSRQAFSNAAEWHGRAGDEAAAVRCKKAASAMETDLSGNIDLSFTEELKDRQVEQEVKGLGACVVLTRLIETTRKAGDHFQAKQLALELTLNLKAINLLDPQEVGIDTAVQSWTTELSSQPNVTEYFRAFASVLQAYFQISATNPSAQLIDAQAILSEATAQEISAKAEFDREWALHYSIAQAEPDPAMADRIAQAEAAANRLQGLKKQFDTEHASILSENESRDYGVSRQDLLARVTQLEQDARALNYRYYDAQARLLHGQILNYDGQLQAAISVFDDACGHLLSLCPEGDPFRWNNTERDLYQTVLYYKVVVLSQLQDSAAISAVCDEAIRNIEAQRYFINSPELQNAFLDWRTNFYLAGIAAARRLEQWDKMLERMELIKARAAIRSSLLSAKPDDSLSQMETDFRAISDEIESGIATEQLKSRRRELWELLSIARTRARISRTPPAVTVAAIQNSINADEVALSYFCMAPGVFLVVVITQESFSVERIELPPEAQSDLSELTEFLQALTSFTGELDDALARFGPLLIPESVRARMRGKKRLVLSPHRTLHLFPFHACPWDQGVIGQHFAVRYTPNLTSLLLPLEPVSGVGLFSLGIRQFTLPPFDQNPLLRAEEEAGHVAELYATAGFAVQLLQGPSASREAFQSLRDSKALENFRWLHLSTHGTSVFEGENLNHPFEASLTFQNGRLDGLEIASLRLNAELVVLSACNSGQRAIGGRGLKEIPGDDVFGLQAALFAAGGRCVLGSLWVVNDDAAFEMMSRFHKHHAAGSPPDVALQEALNEYLTECPRREAFYWSSWFLSTLGNGAGTTTKE